jgi:hypothetical protein
MTSCTGCGAPDDQGCRPGCPEVYCGAHGTYNTDGKEHEGICGLRKGHDGPHFCGRFSWSERAVCNACIAGIHDMCDAKQNRGDCACRCKNDKPLDIPFIASGHNIATDRRVTDVVNHPKHYNEHPSGIECIEIVEHYNFNCGNAIKYIWRAGLKDDAIVDLKKAIWYLEREVERREKMQNED